MTDQGVEKTWFDRAFDDHLMARDLTLVGFLIFGFAGLFKLGMGFFSENISISWGISVGTGVLFAVLWLALMEAWASSRDRSMFRYFFGGDWMEEN